MPTFEITSPEGKKFRITAPEGASKDDAFQYFMDNYKPSQPVQSVAEAEQDSLNKMKGVTDPQNDVLRGLEIGSRGFSDSVLETVGAIPDTIAAGLRKMGAPMPEGRYHTDALKKGWQDVGETVSAPLNAVAPNMGDMTPTSTMDKAVYGAGRGMGDAASIMLPAAAVAKGTKAGTMTNEAAKVLAGQQGVQLGAGAVGGSVGEATNNPYLGTAAAIATGVATGRPAAGKTTKMLTKANDAATKKLSQQASNAYQAADQSGVKASQQSFGQFADDLATKMTDEGIDTVLEPRASRALERVINAKGGEPTIKQLDVLRRVMRRASQSPDKSERHMARQMIDEMDDYIFNLKPNDVVSGSGDVAAATSALKEARNAYMRSSKATTVDDLIQAARDKSSLYTGSGFENALRNEFRKLVGNERRMRLFTAEEQKSLRKVANGGPIENAMRWLGRFAPTNVVNIAGGGFVGNSLGGPIGMVGLPAAGLVGRNVATGMTNRNAELARSLMLGNAAPKAASGSANSQALAQILMAREKDRVMSPQPMPVR
ncbi:hypothetical protein [Thalassospira sp.]|uniref:hypothetical protein n=1 Tax=Thalassospira sp. TaxID=1912094 RepID=UPI001B2088B9|nr:hypothetical protein [Thalassospira sp.]MBO6808453.1 hypothetical protein [Thalassospira sp.]MBO6839849.1 hypothetical protein [Thalassospira sp.]